jgi:HSP20 family molecular chaperone IbpA
MTPNVSHHYVSLPHLSELLHSISIPQAHLPQAHLPHPNLHLPTPSAHPAFDLTETYRAFIVTADLAGLGPEDVVVEANDHFCTLTISGTIPRPDPLVAVAQAAAAHGERPQQQQGDETIGIGHREPQSASHKPDESTQTADVEAAGDSTTAAKPTVHQHVSERRPGAFHRQFRLPSLGELDMAGCRATMHHGLLTVVVPKRTDLPHKTEEEMARARRLRIVASSFAALAPGMPIL